MAWHPSLPLERQERGAGADLEWSTLARILGSLHAEVGAGRLDFHEVAAACRRGELFSDEERWKALARVQDRYREILSSLGYLDREAARREALRPRIVSRSPGRCGWSGHRTFPPVVRAFLEAAAIGVPVRILIGAPEALANRFDSLGAVVPEAWAHVRAGIPEASVRLVSGPGEQADAVVQRLRALEGRHPASEVTIGVPDPGVAPFLTERLGEEGVPTRRPEGTRMEASVTLSAPRRGGCVSGYQGVRSVRGSSPPSRPGANPCPALEGWRGAFACGARGPISCPPPSLHPRSRVAPRWGRAPGQAVEPELRRIREGLLDLLEPLRSSPVLSRNGPPS
jgi:hypothetical protein